MFKRIVDACFEQMPGFMIGMFIGMVMGMIVFVVVQGLMQR